MPWIAEIPDIEKAREQARKALALPLGLSSPLWLAFGAATGAGLAWWWSTRWMQAVNLEAVESAKLAMPAKADAPVVIVAEIAVEPSRQETGDDLTRLFGVGPKMAAALAERGVTSFAALAAWSVDEAQAFDAELNLKGRVARDAWVAQARRLAGAQPES